MDTLDINLGYCYGIKKLNYKFEFNKFKNYLIYAPNGSMKTSLAKTFTDLMEEKETKDLIYPERITVREIIKEDGSNLGKEEIFVIEPYNEEYDSEKKSLLLVNNELKKQYEAIIKNIDNKKDFVIESITDHTGIKKGLQIENELKNVFGCKDIFDVFDKISEEVLNVNIPEFSHIVYSEVFNNDTLAFLQVKSNRENIEDYIRTFNNLVDASPYLKKNFNHYNAITVQKNLVSNGFFSASHSINLFNGVEKIELSGAKEFEELINQEKDKILNNPDLKKKFDAIDKNLKNAGLRNFRTYLFENKEILIELTDYETFRKKLWISYFKTVKEIFHDFIKLFRSGKIALNDINQQAKNEITNWLKVISIFNKRFSVPFFLIVENQENVILKNETPVLGFNFKDSDGEPKKTEKASLLKVLSQGEKRALYLLNIIFEIEARKVTTQNTLFIVDDIADSFDYKNKYAIIEYLKEISEIPFFNLIILSHNYDFFRTVRGRLNLPYNANLSVVNNCGSIDFEVDVYKKTPFITWRKELDNINYFLASIPFVRNISEYCGYKDEYLCLTCLLHLKTASQSFKIKDLEEIYKKFINVVDKLPEEDPETIVIELIFREAEKISNAHEDRLNLESKIVLSMAIRLKAEEFMIKEINNPDFTDNIEGFQTIQLIKKYKEKFPAEEEKLVLLDRVNLMTPENIHVNSFMFEPILDMSCESLISLYSDVRNL